MKYIILLNNEVTEVHYNKTEALESFVEYIKEDGDSFDFEVCAVLDSHKAPEIEDDTEGPKSHYGVDFNKASGDEDNESKITKVELLDAVSSLIDSPIMKDVISEKELEELVILLSNPMQRSLEKAKNIMLGYN